MKYLGVQNIVGLLNQLVLSANQNTSNDLKSGLLRNYFSNGNFATRMLNNSASGLNTPVTVLGKVEQEAITPHAFITNDGFIGQNTIGSSFGDILKNIIESELLTEYVDSMGENYTVYIIIIKGTYIAFFEYFSIASLLEANDIENYEGFIPLQKIFTYKEFLDINSNSTPGDYLQYLQDKNALNLSISTNVDHLRSIGVEGNNLFQHPHILNLLNQQHEDHVHNLFQTIAQNKPGGYIQD